MWRIPKTLVGPMRRYSGAKAVMPFSFSKKPGVGSLLLKATALIEAIRTVKWPARCDRSLNGAELNDEIHFATNVARHHSPQSSGI